METKPHKSETSNNLKPSSLQPPTGQMLKHKLLWILPRRSDLGNSDPESKHLPSTYVCGVIDSQAQITAKWICSLMEIGLFLQEGFLHSEPVFWCSSSHFGFKNVPGVQYKKHINSWHMKKPHPCFTGMWPYCCRSVSLDTNQEVPPMCGLIQMRFYKGMKIFTQLIFQCLIPPTAWWKLQIALKLNKCD